MDELGLAAALRSVRIRGGLRQADIAAKAGVSTATISRLEAGAAENVTFSTIRSVAAAYGVRVGLTARWRGAELDRIISASHAAMHESVSSWLGRFRGWRFVPEASFAFGGERGVVDVLGWHGASRTILVLELKTQVVDVNDLMSTMDRRTRLARRMAVERGWVGRADEPRTAVVSWVVIAEGTANRRRVAAHAQVLSAAFPERGRALAAILHEPARLAGRPSGMGARAGSVSGLSFLPILHHVQARGHGRSSGPVRTRRFESRRA